MTAPIPMQQSSTQGVTPLAAQVPPRQLPPPVPPLESKLLAPGLASSPVLPLPIPPPVPPPVPLTVAPAVPAAPASAFGQFPLSVVAWLFWTAISCVGAATMIVALSILATIPLLQFLSLGYLLEVSGRIARTGKLRAGFIGLRPAGVLGLFGLALYLYWLLLKFASSTAVNAQFIAPGSGSAAPWAGGAFIGLLLLGVGAVFLAGLVFLIWPRSYLFLRDALWNFATKRLWYYAWLGLRGFAGGLAWLAVPVTLILLGSLLPNPDRPFVAFTAGMLRLIGSILLMIAAIHVPFLQARMAAENRFAAMWDFVAARDEFRRAPLAYWFSIAVTLLFALPLYLAKIELVPRDAAWLPSLFFVVFIFPARVLVGWALARARRRQQPRHWVFRVAGRLGMVPFAVFYALIVFFTQYTGWHGVWGLYEQHAFLLPVPFVGL